MKFGKRLRALLDESPKLSNVTLNHKKLKSLLRQDSTGFEEALLEELSAAVTHLNPDAQSVTVMRRRQPGARPQVVKTATPTLYVRGAMLALCLLKILKKANKIGLKPEIVRGIRRRGSLKN